MTASAEHNVDAQKSRPFLVQPGTSESPTQPAGPATADSEAISELWRVHGTALVRFALKLTLGDRQRAEDIVQETLLRAWRRPEVVAAGVNAIRPWLFTVTRHVAIDMWRARSRVEEVAVDRETDRPDPAEPIEQAILAMDVRAALARLTPEHREVIVDMYFHGRSVAEISQSLSIPAGTVKSRAYYGLRELRRVLLGVRQGTQGTPVRTRAGLLAGRLLAGRLLGGPGVAPVRRIGAPRGRSRRGTGRRAWPGCGRRGFARCCGTRTTRRRCRGWTGRRRPGGRC